MSTTSIISRGLIGRKLTAGVQAGPASYAAGGFAVDLKTDLGLDSDPTYCLCAAVSGLYNVHYDSATKKVVVTTAATGVEVVGTTDLSAVNFLIVPMV